MINKWIQERSLPPLRSREEMLDILLKQEYGILPPKPQLVTYSVEKNRVPCRVTAEFCSGRATAYRVTASYDLGEGRSFSFPFQVALPKGEGKYPFIVSINFHDAVPDLFMPTEEIVDNGFAVLSFCYNDITADVKDMTVGLSGVLYPDGTRGMTDPGKIAMWAWAAQRVLDYAETVDSLDMTSAAVCGHSRLGKTALVAAATDERFRFCYSNDSGCCGASLFRGRVGENKHIITNAFPHWFCEAFNRAPDDEKLLPFDQHYLLAAIAPRYVLVGSASEDEWADPRSEFLSAAAASPAYEAHGVSGLICGEDLPETDAFFPDGHVGYHIRPGAHYFSRTDWNRFMSFIMRHRMKTK